LPFSAMKLFHVLLLLTITVTVTPSCRSTKRRDTLSEANSARFSENVSLGAYYRTGMVPTPFYDEQPDSLIGKTPTDILGYHHVVQLLSANAGAEWARVRTESDQVGFIRFSAIKIVPMEDRPNAPKRKINKWGEDRY
jgi:hypothetical protein